MNTEAIFATTQSFINNSLNEDIPLLIEENLSTKPLSSLFSSLQSLNLELSPKVIQDFEDISCICYCSKELIAGGCASGMMAIWKSNIRASTICCKSGVNTMIHSQVHQRIYAGTENGLIIRWSYTRAGDQLFQIPKHKKAVTSLLLIHNDSFMISAGKDCKIYFWYLKIKRNPIEISEHSNEITALKVNEDSTRLFSCDLDGMIIIWSVEHVESIHVVHKLTGTYGVEQLELCKNVLLSADTKGRLIKWSLEDYSQICLVELPSRVTSMCKSSDNRYLFFLLSSVIDFSIRAVTIEKMDVEKMFVIPAAHSEAVNCLCSVPDSNKLISSSKDKTLKIWDFRENYEVRNVISTENSIYSLVVNEELNLILTGDGQGGIQYLRLSGEKRKKELNIKLGCEVNCLMMTGNKMFIIACEGKKIFIWRTRSISNKPVCVFGDNFGHSEDVTSICESVDSRYLFTVSTDRTIKVWDIMIQKYVATLGENRLKGEYKKSEIFGHKKDIVDVKATKNFLFTGSIDGFVIVWSISTYMQLKKLEFEKEVKSVSPSESENCVAAAGESNTIVVWWDFLGENRRQEITGHEDNLIKILVNGPHNTLYSISKDSTIKIWSLDQGYILFSLHFEGLVDLSLSRTQKNIYVLIINKTLNQVKSITNPLYSNDISVYPAEYAYFFKSYLQKIQCHELNIFDEYWANYIIFPHTINLAYIYIDSIRPNLLKLGLSQGVKFLKNKLHQSPLTWAMERNNTQCADVILKKLSKMKLKKNLFAIDSIEKEMNKLIGKNLSCLPQLFENLFEFVTEDVETTGKLKKKAPMISISDTRLLNQENFLDAKANPKKKEFLEYRVSLCKFHFAAGTIESLKLLNSITDCHNSELFRTQLLKAFLMFKWRQNFAILMCETIFFCIGLLVLTLYVLGDRRGALWKLVTLLVFNSASILQNSAKAYHSPKKFIKNAWNLLDLCRISLSFYYITRNFIIAVPHYTGLELLTLCYWARAIGYFRIFNKYRYLLRVIMEIIKDMIPFFLILFTSSIAFAMLLCVSQSDITFYNAFVNVYLLDQTNFHFNLDSLENVIVFFLATLLNPIIMLNLLIAIMGDTYDRVQDDQVVADYREMTELILETEYLIFWNNSKKSEFNYITRCDYMRNLNLEKNEWMGKIRAVKKSLQGLEMKFKWTNRNIDLIQVNLLENLNDVLSVSATLNRRLKEIEIS